MPRSRSKRSHYTPPKPAKPKPSPKWLPYVGIGLVIAGVLLVIGAYVLPIPGGNLNLVIGFVMMAGGLVTLSRWR